MIFFPTEEMKELKKVFEPYLHDAIMDKDAPKEAFDAIEKYFKLEDKLKKAEIESWFE